jgi:hypothetical protein
MATLRMGGAVAAIGAPCNGRSGLAASGSPRSITSRWRPEHRPGMSRRQRRRARRRGQASGRCRGATAARPAAAPRPTGAPPMRPACSLPQPIFRLGGGHKLAAGRALSRLARVPFARHP